MRTTRFAPILAALGAAALISPQAEAGGHTWRVAEVFSNADRTIQYIELVECCGGAGETATNGHNVTSSSRTFTVNRNMVAPTSLKSILLATPAFAALPGVPVPDFVFPAGSVPYFATATADTITYVPYDSFSYTAGQVPTNGYDSFNKVPTGTETTFVAANTPKNYAGTEATISLAPPPAVPDGLGGTTSMKGTKLNAAGTSISITWDTAACTREVGHHILYGEGAGLPTSPGGTYSLTGATCAIGIASPYVWNSAPVPSGGTGLVWWVLVVKNTLSTEGSWGEMSTGAERNGTGPGGSSGLCGVTGKDASNTCGH